MRRLMLLACSLACLLPAPVGAQGGRGGPDCGAVAEPDRIKAVTARGEVELASGRTVLLAGMRLPPAGPQAGRALAWLREQEAREVRVAAWGGPDRWGRIPAEVSLAEAAGPLSLAEALVDRGLALVDPGPADRLCRPGLLRLEREARRDRLGLWAEEAPIPAAATARLAALEGRFVLVEGRVRSVGERRRRTYLNFGASWREDTTAIISQRVWAAMRSRGLDAAGLRGRRVVFRGVLHLSGGPAVEITAAEALEVIDGSD